MKEFYLLKLLNSSSLVVEPRFKIVVMICCCCLRVAVRAADQYLVLVEAERIINNQICLCAIHMLVYIQEETAFNV